MQPISRLRCLSRTVASRERHLRAAVAVLLVWLVLAQSASPATVSITARGHDLSSLQVGDQVVLAVEVQGLAPSEQVVGLAATIVFEAADFEADAPSAGPIVPDPTADPLDFVSFADQGIVDGVFTTLSPEKHLQISDNGEFYEFTAKALRPAVGAFRISFAGLFLFDPINPTHPIEVNIESGSARDYRIVPEPVVGNVLAVAGMFCWCVQRRFHRNRFRESR